MTLIRVNCTKKSLFSVYVYVYVCAHLRLPAFVCEGAEVCVQTQYGEGSSLNVSW